MSIGPDFAFRGAQVNNHSLIVCKDSISLFFLKIFRLQAEDGGLTFFGDPETVLQLHAGCYARCLCHRQISVVPGPVRIDRGGRSPGSHPC